MGQTGLTAILGLATLVFGSIALLVLPTAGTTAPSWLGIVFGVLVGIFGLIELVHMLAEKQYTLLGGMEFLYGLVGAVAILGKGIIGPEILSSIALGFWVITALFFTTVVFSLGGWKALMKAIKNTSG